MKSTVKKALILVLVMVLVIGAMVGMTMLAKEKTVASSGATSLDDLFDEGSLAKDGIEAMRSAGLIDENGKMVALDIRENGASVELDVLANRIANGEDAGDITVNGNAVTADKIMRLQQVNSSLEVIDMLDNDVEITDEHVANLQLLLEDVASGKVNLAGILSGETQQVSVKGVSETPNFRESLVNTLSFLYEVYGLSGGKDEVIAGLTTLYEIGYIDAEGNPVELDPSLGADEINRINNGLELIRILSKDPDAYIEQTVMINYSNLLSFINRKDTFVACYENLLGKSKKEAIAAWDTIFELGLLDSEGNIAKTDRWGDAAEIDRVNQGLEGISLILADRSDEVTKEQVERLDNLLSEIAAGEIDLSDVVPYYGAEAPTFSSINLSEFSYSYSAYLDKGFDKATLDALYRIGYIDANGNPVKLDPALGSETINHINNGLAALRTILDGGTAFRDEITAFDRFTTEVATTLDSLYADIHARVNALVACYETCLDKGKKDAKAALAVLKEVGLIDNSFNLTELSGDAAKIARVNQGLEVLRLLKDGRDDEIAKEHLVALDTLVYDIRVGYVDVYDIVPGVFDETGGVPEWIVTALANAIHRSNEYITDPDERARMYLNKYYEVGLIDSDGQPATLAASGDRPKIYRVSQALEPIYMILQGRENEITQKQIESIINNLYWDIVNGEINVTDVIIPDWKAMPDNNGTGEVVATAGKFVAPYISGTEYEAEHSFELYDPDNTTWYTTADAKVSFYHATTPGAITAEDIGECTAAEAKQWIINNWDDVMHVWEQTTFVFYNGSKLCGLYFSSPEEQTDASVRSKSVNENYQVSYLPNCENLWVCTPSAGYVVGMGIDRPANYNYTYSNDTYAGPKVYVHVKLNKLPAEGETVSVDFNMYSGGNTAGIKLNGASSAQPYSQTITWTSEDTELEKVFEIQAVSINVSSGRKRWGGEMGVVVNVNNPQNATLSGGVTSWTHTEVFVDHGDSELTTDIHTRITDVSVPAGRYYVGQVVPVTVTFHDYVKGTTGTKLTVNGVECSLLGNSTIFDSLTFGYTVRGVDGGALDITDLTGVVDAAGNPVTLEDPIGARQFGLAQGVIIISDVKDGSFDWDNAKYGIDDILGNQTVTIVVPFAPEGDKTWIINDAIEINPGITISVPGYENAKANYYLKSFYFSLDGGETRYPVFVLGDDDAEAFAVRLAVPYNDSVYLRKDTLHLYYDKDLNTTTDYLGAWEDRQTDANGFAYFTDNGTAADLLAARSISYYVKGFCAYDKDATVKRANYNEANVSDGFYKQDYLYVVVPTEDYDREHDVELLVNEALFNASKTGVRSEESNAPLVLNYRLSNRATFTFADPKYFTWSTSDEQIATVKKDEATGQGQIVLNGAGGTVNIILTVGNGSAAKQYDIIFELAILAGKSPFMKIPEYSKERTTLTETDVDVLFSSNLTARNAATGVKETTFTAKLYKVGAVNDEPAGEPIWTANFASTQADTLSHITVPGAKLANAGIYAVVVSASYLGGDVDGFATEPEDFAVTAYIIVKQAPLKVTLKTLDSYSVNYDDLPTIEYTVSHSNANAVVEYTIQKSGEAVSARTSVSGGTIPFAATKPTGLKDAYTITVYAKSNDPMADDTWSMDSMLVRVYNTDILELIVKDVITGEIGGTTGGTGESANGTTIDMDNHGKLPGYGITDGESYQLTFSDLNLLRTDMSLQKIISANYGSGVWGLVSDKMQWTSSDSDLVSINYKQGGTYSDIRYYSYTSYAPTSDFLLVGKDKTDGVTITATHAATGMTASVTVTADTLENQLYVFQFYPKTVTSVTYTNGAGDKRELTSDDKGALAVYEPEGIDSAVMAISRQGDTTYVGTIFAVELQSGERDIASLQLYPCNNLRMRSISNAVLTFLNPDGSAYNGTVTLRAGVYKNGIYCPASKTFLSASPEVKYDATDDIVVTAINGKVTLGFDPTSFKIDPDSLEETGAAATDKITYVIEYRIGGYKTNYVMLTVSTDSMGEQKATDSVIRLISSPTSADVPQITRQTIRQYSDGKALTYAKDVTDFTDYIGLSKLIDKVVLYTDYVLPESVVTYENNIPSVSGEFALYTADGRKLTGQMERASDTADQIFDLADMENSTLYVFPFSSSPIGRSIYTMTDENLAADGISDVGDNAKPSGSIKAVFVKDGITLTSVTLPFGVCNLSHQEPTDGAEDAANEISSTLKSKISIAEIFNTISVNDMLKKGFLFLGGLATTSSDMPLKLMILPTEDPGVFHLIAFVGKRQNQSFGDGRLEIEYDVQKTKDDLKDLFEDNDTKVEASFSGTIILEAGYDFNTKEWKVGFLGGSVGMAFSASYEWTQNFMCGPVPATISFEVGAHAELEVSFASKASVRQMLVDATIGVSLDAFAGVGFDATIAKLKLGIYGSIGADVNFLMLSDFKHAPTTGTQLEIKGEIGIRLEVKVLFINYKETFASTGFNWKKKYNNYDAIQRQWAESGAAEIFGLTKSGRAYSMRLLSNGTAVVAIESGGELENRDYLDLSERAWNSGIAAQRGLRKGAVSSVLVDVQTNAYPYSNPVFVDDGSLFLYISDNDNADELQSVVSFATANGTGYDNMGALYDVDDENAVLADSDVVASGTGSNIFAAWVKQLESPEKEMLDKTTNDDLGMMMNATEIYVGAYDGSVWTTTRLTNNSVADMSPTIASRGEKAIVAWRSLSATKMPASGGEQDFSSMFDAENNIKYRMYDGAAWSEATVAYNGSAGTVTAINSAMLADGTAILVYTVRTGDDVTATETYFTVINAAGVIVTTGRLTNDSYADTNAQVAAVDDQFVVGWYSEYDLGDATIHDIRLARISDDGSVDATFPESIGVDASTDITTDFRFSAPADIDDLSKLSIVWVQKMDSEDTKNTKYELKAMRFYENGGAIGITAPITVAETASNFTVDFYDTYTDESGKVHVLVLGSDYNSLEGLAEYDTIDLTNQPIETSDGSNLLTILDQNPKAYIKLGSGEFKDIAIEVVANTNLKELVPGLDLPVQFAIKNIGTSTVDKVNVQFGEVNKTVEGLALLPNQSTTITIVYPVPEGAVRDVEYTMTADDTAVVVETLVLNRPDVGISDMKLLSEENGERIVQVILYNASDIPLAGSGKTVKLGIYTSPDHEEEKRVGSIITITDADALASIDDGIYSVVQTLSVEDLIGDAEEIPVDGIKLYAYAWVEDCDELYLQNNDESLSFKGLLTKNNGEIITVNTAIQTQTENETTVYIVRADIRNNSMQETSFGMPVALLLDNEGNIIAQKNMQNTSLTLTKEQTVSLSVTFTADELNGKTPATATVGAVYKVTFDVNGGSGTFDPVQTDFEGHITLPENEPTPPEVAAGEEPLLFDGWYTDATNGTLITADYTFTADTTVYARYVTHEHDFSYSVDGATITVICQNTDGRHTGETTATITVAAPTLTVYGEEGSAEATVINNVDGVDTPIIVYKKGDTVLDAAPIVAGTYTANITVGDVTASVTYTIAKKAASVTAANKSKTYGEDDPELTATALGTVGEDTINYTLSRAEGENAGEHIITVILGENPNYDVTVTNANLTIVKKAASVTPADKSKTYGEDDPELTATALGLVGEDVLNYTLSRTIGENVGEYVISVTLGNNPNYDVTITGTATYTINKKAVTLNLYVDGVIVTEATSIIYDGQEHTFVVKAIGANDEVITIGAETQTDVFSSTEFIVYAQNLAADGSEYENYVLDNDYNVPDYAIAAKAITITADDKSSVYGESIVGLTAQITDGNGVYVLPDEDSEVFVLTKEQGVNAGEYVITVNVVGNSNYIVTPVNGIYTINRKAVTVTPDNKTITYGDDDLALTYAITGLVGEEALTGITLTRAEGNNAGTYVITATHDDTLDLNYAVTITGTAAYKINQKAVTVTPDNKTITYGDDDLALTYAITGLVGEETLTGITLTRAEGNNAGTYVITATHDDTLDLNYAVTITGTGAYTIQKKVNTINTDGIVKEYTYSGSNVTVDGATALGDGDISYENNVVKEAGKHTVVVKVTEGMNYLAAETTIDVFVKETAPVLNDESGTNTHGKIISVENALQGTSMTEIFKNAKEDESESKEISATIDTANIVFNEAAIEEISTAGEVELKFSVVYVDESEPIETAALQDAEVIIKVSLSDGITFASGKATITIDLKKDVPEKKIGKVYYVDADGNRTDMNATFADGKVTFETNHFSDYIVVFEDEKGLTGGAIAGIVIGCFFGLLIIAFVILFLLYSRDKNKDDDKKLIKVPFINNMMSKVDAFVSNIGKKKGVPAKAQDKTSEKETADANETTGVVAPQDTCVDAAEEEEDGGVVVDAKGNYFNIRYNKSFSAKLIQSSEETKGYYGELKNEVMSYNKTKSRVSWSYDSINSGRAPVVKFGIRGKTLCVYLPLNAEELDEKYKVETVEAAKYAAVPCMYRIKNERRLRYAKELIAMACASLGLHKGETKTEGYYLPYENTEALVKKGLIKELTVAATDSQIAHAKSEGTIRIVEQVSASEVNSLIANEVAAAAIIVEGSAQRKPTGKKGIINVDTLSANFASGDVITIQSLRDKKLIEPGVKQVKLLARGKLDKVLHVELQDYSLEAVKMVIATGGTVKRVGSAK